MQIDPTGMIAELAYGPFLGADPGTPSLEGPSTLGDKASDDKEKEKKKAEEEKKKKEEEEKKKHTEEKKKRNAAKQAAMMGHLLKLLNWEKPFRFALHDHVNKDGTHTKAFYFEGVIGISGISATGGIAKVYNIPLGNLLMKFQSQEASVTAKFWGKDAGIGLNGDLFFSGVGAAYGGTASYTGLKVGMGVQATEEKANLGAIVGTSTEDIK